ncbi:maker208, partial [Drosophila busckii]
MSDTLHATLLLQLLLLAMSLLLTAANIEHAAYSNEDLLAEESAPVGSLLLRQRRDNWLPHFGCGKQHKWHGHHDYYHHHWPAQPFPYAGFNFGFPMWPNFGFAFDKDAAPPFKTPLAPFNVDSGGLQQQQQRQLVETVTECHLCFADKPPSTAAPETTTATPATTTAAPATTTAAA